MSGNIRVLSDDLANQIAAGEVVERPASVVKELVENALDAGARRIRVDIQHGGQDLIRVADDGAGMDREDAALAVLRHATSKIRSFEDLSRLGSFGFRGEALPSIASVSRFELRTRRAKDAEGTRVLIEGGGAPLIEPAGCAAGTIIEVRDLFFNVPARRKFLKSIATESARVGEVIEAAALALPGTTLILARDGKVAAEHLRVESREDRVQAAFAGEVLAPCLGERGPLVVEAYLSRPERAKSGATGLMIFVNDRPVRDRTLARAVALAYGSVLEAGRYPVGVVYLDIPRELVDVNVHPQKAEVRFADGKAVTDALYRVVADAVRAAFGLPDPGMTWGKKQKLFEEPAPPGPSAWVFTPTTTDPLPLREPVKTPSWPYAAIEPSPATEPSPSPALPIEPPQVIEPHPVIAAPVIAIEHVEGPARPPEMRFGALRFAAQVRGTFLVCEGNDGLYVIDQHAAAERVTFHRLKTAFDAREIASQKLLFPVVVQVRAEEAAVVEDRADEIARTGLDARVIGVGQVAVHAVPSLLGRASPERLLRDLLAEVGHGGERAFSGAIDRALATMACHGSVRAGDAMSAEEARALLTALDEVDFAGHCPHGRPVVMRIGWGELEHRVGRR